MKSGIKAMNKLCSIALIAFLVQCGCSTQIVGTGGASETVAIVVTDNRLSGTISIQDDPAGALKNSEYFVGVYDTVFIPLLPDSNANFRDTTAFPDAAFSFTNLRTGTYNLYIQNRASKKALFLASIAIPAPTQNTREGTLKPCGSISGVIYQLPDSVRTDTTTIPPAWVFVNGSPFLCISNQIGHYMLSDIPEASYRLSILIKDRNDIKGYGPTYTDRNPVIVQEGEDKSYTVFYTKQ
jgi:hypothetical protein